jgi:predicted alpha/beta-hydrolase family hydrolase
VTTDHFFVPDGCDARVSAVLDRPPSARWMYVLAHGAGAGMRHPFLETVADRLSQRGVATFRYQFPYMEAGKSRPDAGALLQSTVRSAIEYASGLAGGLPLVAGGKSLGGRMTSLAASTASLPGVSGIVFLGFPLHAAGRPGVKRAAHLSEVEPPMLFVQGTRDRLANLELLREVCGRLGDRASLYVVEGGDHSFEVLKRSGRTRHEVLDEVVLAVVRWLGQTVPLQGV